MEVKKGYKLTEVGVIPEDWEVKSLGELFKFSGGYTASRDQLSDKGYCYLHYGDIHKSSKQFIDVQNEYEIIPKLDVPLGAISAASLLDDGDVVFVDASEDDEGTSKHIVVVNNERIPYISGLHTIVSKAKTDELCHQFRRFCFQSRDIKRQFYFYSVGTKVSGISKSNIAKLFLSLPPLPEQRAIAEALSDVDGLLVKQGQMLAKKRDIKQGAMQLLLTGKQRLPGFSGEWVVKKFHDVFYKLNAKEHQILATEYQSSGLLPVIDQGKDLIIGFSDRTEKRFECPMSGVVIFGDHTRIIKYVNFDFVVGADGTQILSTKADQVCRFHSYQLMNNEIPNTGYNRHFKFLKEMMFPCPPLPEQTAIAEVLSDMDAELAVLERQREKTKELKQGMMQELLTGRIRLV